MLNARDIPRTKLMSVPEKTVPNLTCRQYDDVIAQARLNEETELLLKAIVADQKCS
jgi:hypothetical protein